MDELRKKSDKELAKMEKKLSEIYKTAQKEISEKWDKYMEQAAKRLAPLEKAYADAKASGDQDLIHKTGFELGKEKKLQTVQNDRFKAMTKETAERLTNVNQVALDYVNGQMPTIYTLNYNETLGEIETEVGKVGVSRSFSLVDENTVKNLVKKDTSLFPQKVIDRAKDEKWNLKAINSQVLQGILQGESIPKISARLRNVTDMNSAAATRNARTMCTTAENNGRMSGMKEAEKKGIVYEKQWMATHDDRTRESHAELDGVSVGLDEEFPNGLQYPGDPAGDPEEVYNCRCSMVRKLIGFRRKDGSISDVDIEDEYKPDYFDTQPREVSNEELPEQKVENENREFTKEKVDVIPANKFEQSARDNLTDLEQKELYDELDKYVDSMKGDTDRLAELLDKMDDVKWNSDKPLYRGIGVEGYDYLSGDNKFEELLASYKSGEPIKMQSLSWTTDNKIAEKFASNNGSYQIVYVDTTDGVREMVSMQGIMEKTEGEWYAKTVKEVLSTNPEMSYIPYKVEKDKNIAYVYVREEKKKR